MEKGKKKYLINMILLLSLVCGVFYFMIKDHINEVLDIVNTMVTRDLVALFAILIANVLIGGLLVTTLGRLYNKDYSIKDGLLAHLISNMFFSITPMGIASYPSSVYIYKKQKMNTEESVSLVMIQTLIKQIFVVIACVYLSAYFLSNPLSATIGGWAFNISTMCMVVCALNVIVSSALLAMCISKRVHYYVSRIIYFFIRVFFRKHKEGFVQKKFDDKIEEMEKALHVLLSNKFMFIRQMSLHLIKTVALYGTPYAIYLLIDRSAIFDMNAFVYWYTSIMFVCYVAAVLPLPGGSVATETFASIVLMSAVNGQSAMLTSIILLWRFFTHYGVVALGTLCMFMPIKEKEKASASDMIAQGFDRIEK